MPFLASFYQCSRFSQFYRRNFAKIFNSCSQNFLSLIICDWQCKQTCSFAVSDVFQDAGVDGQRQRERERDSAVQHDRRFDPFAFAEDWHERNLGKKVS